MQYCRKAVAMRIIESMLRGKYRDQLLCEDGIFIGNKIFAVIDGVTSHGTLLWNGGSSGRFAKDMLCEYLRSHEDELAEMSAKECFHRLNCVLAERGREVYHSLYEGAPAADRLAEDPLCLGAGGGKAGVKGIMEGMESFDDRAYVRVIA